MRRLIVFILFSFLLSCPAVSVMADDTFEPGRTNPIGFPMFSFPFAEGTPSKSVTEKKEEGEAQNLEKKQREIQDKKIDDAIKKAWEEK